MKVVVLAPSADYAANAGARIRYSRLAPFLTARGVTLTIEPLAGFDPRRGPGDVVIISKCHDAHAVLAAEILVQRGVAVGIDLFDDYFSQVDDSRLIQRRAWLKHMSRLCNFALCSTARMAAVVADLAPDLRVHVLNDPAPAINPLGLGATLVEKLAETKASSSLRVGWFGIGDNPHFAVGLSDLAAFADALVQLSASGLAVELSVLTNERSLDSAGLAAIATLPVPTSVDLWSEAAEAALLRRSMLCFLPVNMQRFSVAKSLNRAVTALAGGCQVLSIGYPLYQALDPLIYRDVDDFLGDVRAGSMRHSADALPSFLQKIDEVASPEVESAALTHFLGEVRATTIPPRSERLFLVHVTVSSRAAHVLAKRSGMLTVRSPFCETALDCDVMVEAMPGRRLSMIVSNSAIRQASSADRRRATVRRIAGRKYWEISEAPLDDLADTSWPEPSLPLQLALYPSVMTGIARLLERTFGTGRVLVSENSPLPFRPAA